jgi:hypothetical protein
LTFQNLISVSCKDATHQSIRAESDFFCATGFQTDFEPASPNQDGQHYMCGIYKPPRRHNVSQLIKNRGGSVEIVFKTEHNASGRTHPGGKECNSGSSISHENDKERVDVETGNLSTDQQAMGTVSGRLICESDQHPASEVLFVDSGSIRRSSQCISPAVKQDAIVGQSTMDPNSSSLSKNNSRQGYSGSSSSVLGVSPVVPSPGQSADITSDNTIRRRFTSSNSSTSTISSTESQLENPRLQYIRTRYETKGFSQKAINLFVSSLDNGSTRTVSSSLRTWLSWCEINSCDPTTCAVNRICDFFVDMLAKEMSFNTIAGYRTAISEIHDHVDGVSIGSHPDIAKIMQAIHWENPPPSRQDEPIDLTPSLKFIHDLGDNDSMAIRDLFIKTAFLMALVTASRPSDLRRIDLTTVKVSRTSITMDCINPKEYNIARSHSLSTTKSPNKRIYIGSYDDDPQLCPYKALTVLLERTELWRSTPDKKKAIFLISRDPHTPAATDTIANWIKTVVQRSSSSSTAKDIRALSAFFLQNSGADLASILALGNWSSNAVYQRFYQRGVKKMLERNQVSTLILNEASSEADN